ncbi:hypothetical protein PN466_05630 [Roseofilum reptotaenium CS-1145]|nr:DUF6789 family protein [Roseofilum reptotaenium]MDB9516440.1 hypothetical protein [Roseofilum reptotaenium CS-1145]
MASGAALVISIVTNASLPIILICLGIFAGFLSISKWSRSSHQERKIIQAKAITGVVAGAIATIAYDVSRELIVRLFNIPLDPFKALPVFGELIVGSNAPETTIIISGILYHVLNGVLFGVAYCFFFGNRNWKWGIVWAMALEIAMFTIYPTWLNLDAVMREFTLISMSGHIVYGAVLGLLCNRWLNINNR